MPLIELIVILIVIGVGLYLISLIPMDANIKKIIQVLVIVLVVLWILSLFFPFGHIMVGRP